MNKLRKIFAMVLIVAFVSFGLTGCKDKSEHEHPAGEHPTEEAVTDEHPTSEHPTEEAVTDEHPASEHPAGEHPK